MIYALFDFLSVPEGHPDFEALQHRDLLQQLVNRVFVPFCDLRTDRIQRRRGGQVALQVSGGVQLLDTDDILYLETRDRLLHYHTATDTWSVRGSLLKAEKDLAAYHFARCNQCYLVNLRHVRGVQDDLVQVGEERLEISRRQRTAFLAALAAYVGGAL